MNLPALRRRHLLAYIVVSCALAVACLNVVPGGSLGAVVVQTAAARSRRYRGARAVSIRAALKGRHPAPRNARGAFLMCAGVLAIALAAGLATVGLAGAEAGIKPPGSADIALFLILCLLTGVFEEALFRGVLFRSFAEVLEGTGTYRPLLVAAAASAAIFGILHVSGTAAPPVDAVSLVQLAGKPVQAALFGVIMAGVYAQSGNLRVGRRRACGAQCPVRAAVVRDERPAGGNLCDGQPRRPGRAAGNDRTVRSACRRCSARPGTSRSAGLTLPQTFARVHSVTPLAAPRLLMPTWYYTSSANERASSAPSRFCGEL